MLSDIMDLTSSKFFEAGPPSYLVSNMEPPLEGNTGFYKRNTENPFADTFPDPLCKLNLRETSEFVKSFPMANHVSESRNYLDISAQRRRSEGVSLSLSTVTKRNAEAPSTPGRPIFGYSSGKNLTRKGFPSKWDDAEKWLNGSGSPAHHHGLLNPSEPLKISKQCEQFKPQAEVLAEKSRFTEKKISKAVSSIQSSVALVVHNSASAFNGVPASAEVLLKDKLTKEVESIFPKFCCPEPRREGLLIGNLGDKAMKGAAATEVVYDEVKHRDIGTEMTPFGSSTTSRCPTPFKSISPVRHNTPADRSGPLDLINSSSNGTNIAQLQDCHLAKLRVDSVAASTWSSREEEEEDISKSLRHFDIGNEFRRSVSESRAYKWEAEEKKKGCLRYKREEGKIEAWMNLESAKAEAQSRKLEVKIQKMRSDVEEKLMKRMANVHRKAEEWRAEAQLQHTEEMQRATKQAQKMANHKNSHFSGHGSCGCFPCNNHL